MVRAPLHFHGRIPVPEVTPLTYRDSVTHLELVYELSQYLKNILHPSLQSTVDQVVADMERLLDEANDQYVEGVEEFQRIHDAFMSDVNAHLIALNDSAVTGLVNDQTSLLGQAVRQTIFDSVSDIYINVRDFGAEGDGEHNDTNAFQEAIDYAYTVGGTVFVPTGHFIITRPLELHETFSMHSSIVNGSSSFKLDRPGGSLIETRTSRVFTAKPGVEEIKIIMYGGHFRPDRREHGMLFDDSFVMVRSHISHVVTTQYNHVFACRLRAVCVIENTMHTDVGVGFMTGNITDSYVSHNYVNGDINHGINTIGVHLGPGTFQAVFHNNFFDFMKKAFEFSFPSPRVVISNNSIEWCFEGISTVDGDRILVNDIKIHDNTFYRIRTNDWEEHATSPDREMLSRDATVIRFPRGLRHASIQGNHFIDCHQGIHVGSSPVLHIREHTNIFDNVDTPVEYQGWHASNYEGSLENIYFESLDYAEFSTVPGSLTTSPNNESDGNTRFTNQHIVVNNVPLMNRDGTWYDYSGTSYSRGDTL